MNLNLTLPGMGGGAKKKQKVEPKPLVKRRYWTPDPNDETLYKGDPGYQGDAPEGYNAQDAFYANKVYDKKTGEWVNAKKLGDDIYRKNDAGEILMWQAPQQPAKRGLLK